MYVHAIILTPRALENGKHRATKGILHDACGLDAASLNSSAGGSSRLIAVAQ
jgi:hypothetical protein